MIFIKNFYLNSPGNGSKSSVIHDVKSAILDSKITTGLVTVFTAMGKAGITAASKKEIEGDDLIISRTLTIPFNEGQLLLDPWQEIYLIDKDESGRRRQFTVHIMGDGAEAKGAPGAGPPPGGAPQQKGQPLAKIETKKKFIKA